MKRFIISGVPGAGKTAIIRELEFEGFGVVEEAATDVIAKAQAAGRPEPWTDPSFIEAIARLQQEREIWPRRSPIEFSFTIAVVRTGPCGLSQISLPAFSAGGA